MSPDVRVQRSIVHDDALIEAALGDGPLPLGHADRVLAPFITINGHIHGLTSDFLRHHCLARPERGTATRIASDVVGWVDYLVNHRGHHPFEDHRDPVLAATEEDFFRLSGNIGDMTRDGKSAGVRCPACGFP
ncbi:hypothetical protein [Streptomyces atratus]|uniref:hypothetical protein n=1 Tax=Streptomyces atratus TaxID=1893 RepID=UPI003406B4D6